MGYHVILQNLDTKEHIDMGKAIHKDKSFQMPDDAIVAFLYKCIGSNIKIETDGSFDSEERNSEQVDTWTNYLK